MLTEQLCATITLPEPRYSSNISIEEALINRTSTRSYKNEAVSLASIGQLLWAGQGITGKGGIRTAPSAGGVFPLNLYVVAGKILSLSAGIYKYNPALHEISLQRGHDVTPLLASAAHMQTPLQECAAVIVITANFNLCFQKYGERAERLVQLEAGHVAQNIYLQAAAMEIGTVSIGSFTDSDVHESLHLPHDESPLYLMPVGIR